MSRSWKPHKLPAHQSEPVSQAVCPWVAGCVLAVLLNCPSLPWTDSAQPLLLLVRVQGGTSPPWADSVQPLPMLVRVQGGTSPPWAVSAATRWSC
eukprot:934049-Amphidinium_carterae.1